LATDKLPLIYMQNSGIGNIVNPLLSLSDPEVYSIPMLLMIGWKGQPGIKDKPQHKKQGRVTIKMLKTMEVPYQILSADKTDAQADEIIKTATKEALKNNAPYAIVVKKDSFSKNRVNENKIVKNLDDNDIIISTTGATSRELFKYREELNQGHEKDFLNFS
jgi:phosphonopyruvate decarboxylase